MLRQTLLLIASAKLVAASNDTYVGTTDLLEHLFKSYDRRVRPYADNKTAVYVHMTIVLGIMIEMHENEQVVSFVISHTQRWRDPKLVWNPSDFNGMNEAIVPQSMLWLPKMFVYNSMDTKDMLTDEKYDVRLRHDGQIKINIPQHVTCICRLNIEQFPFDTQFCAVALASPLLTVEEMNVVSHSPPRDSYFAGNAEWQLENVSVRHMSFLEEGEYRAEVHYIFQLRRRPVFYVTVIVVPIFLISALSILGIFTPGANDAPRNEKVSLGLGSLLAMTVLLGIVADSMPKSNSIPLLGYYILSVILQCAIAVGVSMTFVILNRRLVDSGEYPRIFAYRLMFLRPKIFPRMRRREEDRKASGMETAPLISNGYTSSSCSSANNSKSSKSASISIPNGDSVNVTVSTKNTSGFGSDDLARIHTVVCYLAETQRIIRRKLEKDQLRMAIEKEWNRIFTRVDYASLVFFQALNAASLIFFLQFAWAVSPEMREPLV